MITPILGTEEAKRRDLIALVKNARCRMQVHKKKAFAIERYVCHSLMCPRRLNVNTNAHIRFVSCRFYW